LSAKPDIRTIIFHNNYTRVSDVMNAEPKKSASETEETGIFTEEPAADEAAAGSAPELAPDPVATLEAERNELKDKLLRTLAEMENLRRRTEREVADGRNYAVTNFARDMLNVVDNLSRALESIPKDERENAAGSFKALIEGVELTERDMLKSLERHGVRKIDPAGEKFDPNLHQAMFEAPDLATPKGFVTQVVQPGFVIAGRSLRAALVGVSSGSPKTDVPKPHSPESDAAG
jgi:molecular chaperone GrpE